MFKDNQRADIVIKDWGIAIEVLRTEKLKDFIKKSYPMPTIPMPADWKPENIYEMMEDLEATNGTGWEYYKRRHMELMGK